MISADWVLMMARYAAWQNESQMAAASDLSKEALRTNRGAFFGSIEATLNHLLWGDRIWLSRFGGCNPPAGGIPESTLMTPHWEAYCDLRRGTDHALKVWAAGLEDDDLDGDLSWHSGALKREVTKPRALCLTHMLNHGTHHRGQIHAMLTAAGAKPGDTDLFIMPEETP